MTRHPFFLYLEAFPLNIWKKCVKLSCVSLQQMECTRHQKWTVLLWDPHSQIYSIIRISPCKKKTIFLKKSTNQTTGVVGNTFIFVEEEKKNRICILITGGGGVKACGRIWRVGSGWAKIRLPVYSKASTVVTLSRELYRRTHGTITITDPPEHTVGGRLGILGHDLGVACFRLSFWKSFKLGLN